MHKEFICAIQGAMESSTWEEIWLPPIVTIFSVLITVIATAWATVRQLQHQAQLNAENRRIETKREVILEGVRGMYRAHAAFGNMTNFDIPDAEILKEFQEGMARLATAGAVASLKTVGAWRDFTELFGPMFMRMFSRRMQVRVSFGGSVGSREGLVKSFVKELTDELPKLATAQAAVLAAIRQDVEIDKETDEEQFKIASKVNPEIMKKAVDEALG